LQLYTSASDYKVVGKISGAILQKPFQLFRRIPNDVNIITKAPSL